MPKDNCSLNNKSVKKPYKIITTEDTKVSFVVNKSLYRLFANIRAMLSPPADEHNRNAVTLFD